MKSRGFLVSNSSSSSFLINLYDEKDFLHPRRILSTEQEGELIKYGFRPSYTRLSYHLQAQHIEEYEEKISPPEGKEELEPYLLGYSISCNQDNVILFLCRRGIPFIASCHSGHETVVYQGGEDLLVIQNPGNFAEFYWSNSRLDEIEKMARQTKCVTRRSWRDYIK